MNWYCVMLRPWGKLAAPAFGLVKLYGSKFANAWPKLNVEAAVADEKIAT